MTNGQLDPLLRHIRALVGERLAGETDGQLLERFAATGEEAAFAALVQRYGRLIFSVCRRVLRHAQDAEDAFQATFLILAHKAASIRRRESVASWLYGVAYRVASKAKADAIHRREQDKPAPVMPVTEPQADVMARELVQVLDEELSRMPERYRAPILLCCLAGKTQEQAARELGWPLGSMSRWLTRGKEMLRKRLTRRGITVSAPLLGTALAGLSAEAGPAPLLTAATVKAAVSSFAGITMAGLVSARVVALTEGVLRTMLVTKMTFTKVLLLCAGLTATGAGVLAYQKGGPGGGPPQGPGVSVPKGNAPEAPGPVGAGAPTGGRPPSGAGVGGIPPDPFNVDGSVPHTDEARQFVKAEVTILMDQQGQRKTPPVTITVDQSSIGMLVTFFRGMGQGKKGDPPGAWKPGIVVLFHPAKGEPHKVTVHWEGDVWSEGNGDWDVSNPTNYAGGLLGFIHDMVTAAELKALEGTWKAVSVEEDGRRWPDTEFKDLRWVIRDSRITFWKAGRRFVRAIQLASDQRIHAMDLYLDSKEASVLPGVGAMGGGSPRRPGGLGGVGPGGVPGPGGGGNLTGMGPGGMMPGMGGMMGMPVGFGGMMGGAFYPAIYSLDGDELKVCEGHDGNRPNDFFTVHKGAQRIFYVFKREKEAARGGPTGEMRTKEQTGVWSKPVNGLSGRLLVAFEDLKPGLRHAVTLELKNVSTKPLAILNQPKLDVSLTDANGLVIPTESFPMSGPIPNPQWATLPREAYLGFRVDMTTVGVPAKDRVLLAFGGKMWGLKPGSYTLRVKVSPADPTHNDAWGGELELPPVEIVVTKEQVTER